jgi:peptide/nickel transport system ATP-binding protein
MKSLLEEMEPFNPPKTAEPVLKLREVKKHYEVGGRFFQIRSTSKGTVKAVDGVTLSVDRGYTMGVVGESGCGKTTLIRTIMGLLAPTSGEILLDNRPLKAGVDRRPLPTIKKLQMVFQNPEASLNPRQTVAQAVQRPMVKLQDMTAEQIVTRTFELLDAVNLPASFYNRLPSELSGGEKQRVAIARAFAADPRVVLLDEPLSALDVSVQASLINLLFDLQRRLHTTYLFISHDLAAVQHLSDWIAVMYLGRIVETGRSDDVFNPPYHPYTEALLSAIPIADPDVAQQHIRLEGSVPSALAIPPGCPFHTRCPRVLGALCREEAPSWQDGEDGHGIWCHIPLEKLAAIQPVAFTREETTEGTLP